MASAIEGAQNVQMKEIRGLGDRLSGLEQLLLEAKRLVQEQQKLAAAFVQNQQRASGLRDVSILPDLCASHRQQLLVMQKNHQQIISICNRSGKAHKYSHDFNPNKGGGGPSGPPPCRYPYAISKRSEILSCPLVTFNFKTFPKHRQT